jgi:single-stranded DNA-binding protein
MGLINNICFESWVCTDPKVNEHKRDDGKKISFMNFTVSVNDGKKHVDKTSRETALLPIEACGYLVDQLVDLLQKGDKVLIQGGLFVKPWMSKEGKKEPGYRIRATDVRVLESKKAEEPASFRF